MDLSKVYALWGKARPSAGSGHGWHPLICHSLDVAAAGERLLALHESGAAALAGRLAWPPEVFKRAVLFLLAVHDLGKVARTFQAKVPELWPEAVLGPFPQTLPADPGHGAVGIWLGLELEPAIFAPALEGWELEEREALLAPFFGHHGRPVEVPNNAMTRHVLGSPGRAAARDLVAAMLEHFEPPRLPMPDLRRLHQASWWLAGLAVLADWLGSWQSTFPYEPPPQSLHDYWNLARERAGEAVRRAGLEPAAPATATGLEPLTGQAWEASAVQAWAERVPLSEGPVCAFIEDVTGSGKTEAALVLAHRLMAEGRARGLFVALPTMATANAMYGRLADLYRRMFEPGRAPSLALAHGRAALDERFRRAVEGLGDGPGEKLDVAWGPEDDQHGDASSAACSAWLASESRKAFLAEVGVGTIDQALLAVLPAKFQALRLFGLADRVLIVDEAHAYDAYMSEELARLLEFQAAMGGSAIVLSATLPETARSKLAAAFIRGLGGTLPALEARDYPRVTLLSGTAGSDETMASRPDLGRRLTVERLDDSQLAMRLLVEASADGAACAWVRNTVDDAIEAAEALEAEGHDVTLFHARMAMGDRLAIERDVVNRFGKDGDPAQRPGIVVATQVIEQSLDLDFDLMVSDLAPVDLLLQRAGRLWRHMAERPGADRPVAGEDPRLLVLSPDPAGEVTKDWLSAMFPRSGAIYAAAILWKTASVLVSEWGGSLRVPEDVRAVVEAVYGEAALADVPAALDRSAEEAEGDRQAGRAHAWANLLLLGNGYGGEHGGWQHDVQTPTRLGEEQITLRLARMEDGRAVPWCSDSDPRRAWALSEVSVRRARVTGVPDPADDAVAAAIARAKAPWPEWEREAIPILLLDGATDEAGQGMVLTRHGAGPVTYHRRSGLKLP